MSPIPSGYQLHVHSWEGDADYNRVEILSGLTEEDVRFYLELLPYFNSNHGWNNPGHGNESLDTNDFIICLDKCMANHPNISDSVREVWTMSEDEINEILDYEDEDIDPREELIYERICENLLGYPENESYNGTSDLRVFDKYEVYFVEKPIIDVTDKFK